MLILIELYPVAYMLTFSIHIPYLIVPQTGRIPNPVGPFLRGALFLGLIVFLFGMS